MAIIPFGASNRYGISEMDSRMDLPKPPPVPRLDALLPPQMAEKAESIGVQKTRLDTWSLLTLAVLAGAFIGFGALFSTVVLAGAESGLPFGVARLLAGIVFSLGLVLVIVGGAELFTGNNLMVMAWASGQVRASEVLRAWGVVYVGNLIGAVATAALVFLTDEHVHGGGAVGATALAIAQSKASLGFFPALALGTLANVLVCLAVWLCYSARTVADKILAIVPPIAAFVAAGFEHSVANMYFIPYGMMVKYGAAASFWKGGLSPDAFPAVTIGGFIANVVPVSIGNVIGGGVLVGAVYWFVYLRGRSKSAK
jgi:formate transporter